MKNNNLLDQYFKGQLSEQEANIVEEAIVKATIEYDETNQMLNTFAQWRAEEAQQKKSTQKLFSFTQWRNGQAQQKAQTRNFYMLAVAATVLLLIVALPFYTFYSSRNADKTSVPIAENPTNPVSPPADETQPAIPNNVPLVDNKKTNKVTVDVSKTTKQAEKREIVISQPLIPNPQPSDTPPQYLAVAETYFEESVLELSDTKMSVERIDSLRYDASKAYKAKEYQRFVNSINQLINRENLTAKDYLFLGEAELKLKNYKQAILHFLKAEQLDPENGKDTRTWHLAIAYILDNQLAKARSTLEGSISDETSAFKEKALLLKKILE